MGGMRTQPAGQGFRPDNYLVYYMQISKKGCDSMVCPKCGTQYDEKLNRCPNCGAISHIPTPPRFGFSKKQNPVETSDSQPTTPPSDEADTTTQQPVEHHTEPVEPSADASVKTDVPDNPPADVPVQQEEKIIRLEDQKDKPSVESFGEQENVRPSRSGRFSSDYGSRRTKRDAAQSRKELEESRKARAAKRAGLPVEPVSELPEEDTDSVKNDLSEESKQTEKRKKEKNALPKTTVKKRGLDDPPKRRWWLIASVIVVAVLALGVGANALVTSNYSSWSNMFYYVFGIGSPPALQPVQIEATTGTDGQAAHTFTMFGRSPDVVLATSLGDQKITFVEGKATVTVADSYFLPADITSDDETMSVQLEFYSMDKQENKTLYPCDPFEITVPQAEVSDMSPAEDASSVTTETAPITMTVPEGASVLINGQDQSASISAEHVFSYNIPVNMGANTVQVEVRAPYRRPYKRTLTITRNLPAVSMQFTTSIPKRTEKDSITFSGKVEPNAKLTLKSDGKLNYTAKTGEFTVTMPLATQKLYNIELRATLDGRSEGVLTAQIERAPSLEEYKKAAINVSIVRLFSNPNDYVMKALYFTGGEVTAIDGSNYTVSFGTDRSLVFEYHGDPVSVGSRVHIYGHIGSIPSNAPVSCYAWYMIKQ